MRNVVTDNTTGTSQVKTIRFFFFFFFSDFQPFYGL